MVRFKKKQQEFSEGYVMPKMTGTADAWMVANVDGWMNERTENQIPISHHAWGKSDKKNPKKCYSR